MVTDLVFFDESDEIRRRVAGQGGLGEMRIRGNKIFRLAINVCEIAAPAAGNQNLFYDAIRPLQQCDAAATLAGYGGAEKSGGAGTEDHNVETAAQRKAP